MGFRKVLLLFSFDNQKCRAAEKHGCGERKMPNADLKPENHPARGPISIGRSQGIATLPPPQLAIMIDPKAINMNASLQAFR